MALVGDIFHSIGKLFGGGADASTIINQAGPAPVQPAAQQQAAPRDNGLQSMNPTFLSAAAMPNAAISQSGGKTLLGQ